MKRNTITLQFTFNGILILNNKKLNEYDLNDCVDKYKVINSQIFIKKIKNILDELKINQHLLTDNIDIIIDKTYNQIDKDILERTFKDLSFNKIIFFNITDKLLTCNTDAMVSVHQKALKIFYLNEVIYIDIYFNKYKEIIEILLKELNTKYNIKTIKLYGDNKIIDEILKLYEKNKKVQLYKFSYPNQIPINLL